MVIIVVRYVRYDLWFNISSRLLEYSQIEFDLPFPVEQDGKFYLIRLTVNPLRNFEIRLDTAGLSINEEIIPGNVIPHYYTTDNMFLFLSTLQYIHQQLEKFDITKGVVGGIEFLQKINDTRNVIDEICTLLLSQYGFDLRTASPKEIEEFVLKDSLTPEMIEKLGVDPLEYYDKKKIREISAKSNTLGREASNIMFVNGAPMAVMLPNPLIPEDVIIVPKTIADNLLVPDDTSFMFRNPDMVRVITISEEFVKAAGIEVTKEPIKIGDKLYYKFVVPKGAKIRFDGNDVVITDLAENVTIRVPKHVLGPVFRIALDGDVVDLIRFPILAEIGISRLKIVINDDPNFNAILINPAIAKPFNLDFDGDKMRVISQSMTRLAEKRARELQQLARTYGVFEKDGSINFDNLQKLIKDEPKALQDFKLLVGENDYRQLVKDIKERRMSKLVGRFLAILKRGYSIRMGLVDGKLKITAIPYTEAERVFLTHPSRYAQKLEYIQQTELPFTALAIANKFDEFKDKLQKAKEAVKQHPMIVQNKGWLIGFLNAKASKVIDKLDSETREFIFGKSNITETEFKRLITSLEDDKLAYLVLKLKEKGFFEIEHVNLTSLTTMLKATSKRYNLLSYIIAKEVGRFIASAKVDDVFNLEKFYDKLHNAILRNLKPSTVIEFGIEPDLIDDLKRYLDRVKSEVEREIKKSGKISAQFFSDLAKQFEKEITDERLRTAINVILQHGFAHGFQLYAESILPYLHECLLTQKAPFFKVQRFYEEAKKQVKLKEFAQWSSSAYKKLTDIFGQRIEELTIGQLSHFTDVIAAYGILKTLGVADEFKDQLRQYVSIDKTLFDQLIQKVDEMLVKEGLKYPVTKAKTPEEKLSYLFAGLQATASVVTEYSKYGFKLLQEWIDKKELRERIKININGQLVSLADLELKDWGLLQAAYKLRGKSQHLVFMALEKWLNAKTGFAAWKSLGSMGILQDALQDAITNALLGKEVRVDKIEQFIKEAARTFGVSHTSLLNDTLFDDYLNMLQQIEGIFLRNTAVALPGQVAQFYDAGVTLSIIERLERTGTFVNQEILDVARQIGMALIKSNPDLRDEVEKFNKIINTLKELQEQVKHAKSTYDFSAIQQTIDKLKQLGIDINDWNEVERKVNEIRKKIDRLIEQALPKSEVYVMQNVQNTSVVKKTMALLLEQTGKGYRTERGHKKFTFEDALKQFEFEPGKILHERIETVLAANKAAIETKSYIVNIYDSKTLMDLNDDINNIIIAENLLREGKKDEALKHLQKIKHKEIFGLRDLTSIDERKLNDILRLTDIVIAIPTLAIKGIDSIKFELDNVSLSRTLTKYIKTFIGSRLLSAHYKAVKLLYETRDVKQAERMMLEEINKINELLKAFGLKSKLTAKFGYITHTELRTAKDMLVQLLRNVEPNDGILPLITPALWEGLSSYLGQTTAPRVEILVKQAYSAMTPQNAFWMYSKENWGSSIVYKDLKDYLKSTYNIFGSYGEAVKLNIALVDFTAFNIEDAVLWLGLKDKSEKVKVKLKELIQSNDKHVKLQEMLKEAVKQGAAPIISYRPIVLGKNVLSYSEDNIKNVKVMYSDGSVKKIKKANLLTLMENKDIVAIIVDKHTQVLTEKNGWENLSAKTKGVIVAVNTVGGTDQILVADMFDANVIKMAIAASGQKGQAGSPFSWYMNVIAEMYKHLKDKKQIDEGLKDFLETLTEERSYRFEIDVGEIYRDAIRELESKLSNLPKDSPLREVYENALEELRRKSKVPVHALFGGMILITRLEQATLASGLEANITYVIKTLANAFGKQDVLKVFSSTTGIEFIGDKRSVRFSKESEDGFGGIYTWLKSIGVKPSLTSEGFEIDNVKFEQFCKEIASIFDFSPDIQKEFERMLNKSLRTLFTELEGSPNLIYSDKYGFRLRALTFLETSVKILKQIASAEMVTYKDEGEKKQAVSYRVMEMVMSFPDVLPTILAGTETTKLKVIVDKSNPLHIHYITDKEDVVLSDKLRKHYTIKEVILPVEQAKWLQTAFDMLKLSGKIITNVGYNREIVEKIDSNVYFDVYKYYDLTNQPVVWSHEQKLLGEVLTQKTMKLFHVAGMVLEAMSAEAAKFLLPTLAFQIMDQSAVTITFEQYEKLIQLIKNRDVEGLKVWLEDLKSKGIKVRDPVKTAEQYIADIFGMKGKITTILNPVSTNVRKALCNKLTELLDVNSVKRQDMKLTFIEKDGVFQFTDDKDKTILKDFIKALNKNSKIIAWIDHGRYTVGILNHDLLKAFFTYLYWPVFQLFNYSFEDVMKIGSLLAQGYALQVFHDKKTGKVWFEIVRDINETSWFMEWGLKVEGPLKMPSTMALLLAAQLYVVDEKTGKTIYDLVSGELEHGLYTSTEVVASYKRIHEIAKLTETLKYQVLAEIMAEGDKTFETIVKNTFKLAAAKALPYGENEQAFRQVAIAFINTIMDVLGKVKGKQFTDAETIANTLENIRKALEENIDLEEVGKELEKMGIRLKDVNTVLSAFYTQVKTTVEGLKGVFTAGNIKPSERTWIISGLSRIYPWLAEYVIRSGAIPLVGKQWGLSTLTTPTVLTLQGMLYQINQLERRFYDMWRTGVKHEVPLALRPYYAHIEKSRDILAKHLLKQMKEAGSLPELYRAMEVAKGFGIPLAPQELTPTPQTLARVLARQYSNILNIEARVPVRMIEHERSVRLAVEQWKKELEAIQNVMVFISRNLGVPLHELMNNLTVNVVIPRKLKTDLFNFIYEWNQFIRASTGMGVTFSTNLKTLAKIYKSFRNRMESFEFYLKDTETGEMKPIRVRESKGYLQFYDEQGKQIKPLRGQMIVARAIAPSGLPFEFIVSNLSAPRKIGVSAPSGISSPTVRTISWRKIDEPIREALTNMLSRWMIESQNRTVEDVISQLENILAGFGYQTENLLNNREYLNIATQRNPKLMAMLIATKLKRHAETQPLGTVIKNLFQNIETLDMFVSEAFRLGLIRTSKRGIIVPEQQLKALERDIESQIKKAIISKTSASLDIAKNIAYVKEIAKNIGLSDKIVKDIEDTLDKVTSPDMLRKVELPVYEALINALGVQIKAMISGLPLEDEITKITSELTDKIKRAEIVNKDKPTRAFKVKSGKGLEEFVELLGIYNTLSELTSNKKFKRTTQQYFMLKALVDVLANEGGLEWTDEDINELKDLQLKFTDNRRLLAQYASTLVSFLRLTKVGKTPKYTELTWDKLTEIIVKKQELEKMFSQKLQTNEITKIEPLVNQELLKQFTAYRYWYVRGLNLEHLKRYEKLYEMMSNVSAADYTKRYQETLKAMGLLLARSKPFEGYSISANKDVNALVERVLKGQELPFTVYEKHRSEIVKALRSAYEALGKLIRSEDVGKALETTLKLHGFYGVERGGQYSLSEFINEEIDKLKGIEKSTGSPEATYAKVLKAYQNLMQITDILMRSKFEIPLSTFRDESKQLQTIFKNASDVLKITVNSSALWLSYLEDCKKRLESLTVISPEISNVVEQLQKIISGESEGNFVQSMQTLSMTIDSVLKVYGHKLSPNTIKVLKDLQAVSRIYSELDVLTSMNLLSRMYEPMNLPSQRLQTPLTSYFIGEMIKSGKDIFEFVNLTDLARSAYVRSRRVYDLQQKYERVIKQLEEEIESLYGNEKYRGIIGTPTFTTLQNIVSKYAFKYAYEKTFSEEFTGTSMLDVVNKLQELRKTMDVNKFREFIRLYTNANKELLKVLLVNESGTIYFKSGTFKQALQSTYKIPFVKPEVFETIIELNELPNKIHKLVNEYLENIPKESLVDFVKSRLKLKLNKYFGEDWSKVFDVVATPLLQSELNRILTERKLQASRTRNVVAIGDIHASTFEELYDTIKQFAKISKNIVLAGDIADEPIKAMKFLKQLANNFEELEKVGIEQIHVALGNHDVMIRNIKKFKKDISEIARELNVDIKDLNLDKTEDVIKAVKRIYESISKISGGKIQIGDVITVEDQGQVAIFAHTGKYAYQEANMKMEPIAYIARQTAEGEAKVIPLTGFHEHPGYKIKTVYYTAISKQPAIKAVNSDEIFSVINRLNETRSSNNQPTNHNRGVGSGTSFAPIALPFSISELHFNPDLFTLMSLMPIAIELYPTLKQWADRVGITNKIKQIPPEIAKFGLISGATTALLSGAIQFPWLDASMVPIIGGLLPLAEFAMFPAIMTLAYLGAALGSEKGNVKEFWKQARQNAGILTAVPGALIGGILGLATGGVIPALVGLATGAIKGYVLGNLGSIIGLLPYGIGKELGPLNRFLYKLQARVIEADKSLTGESDVINLYQLSSLPKQHKDFASRLTGIIGNYYVIEELGQQPQSLRTLDMMKAQQNAMMVGMIVSNMLRMFDSEFKPLIRTTNDLARAITAAEKAIKEFNSASEDTIKDLGTFAKVLTLEAIKKFNEIKEPNEMAKTITSKIYGNWYTGFRFNEYEILERMNRYQRLELGMRTFQQTLRSTTDDLTARLTVEQMKMWAPIVKNLTIPERQEYAIKQLKRLVDIEKITNAISTGNISNLISDLTSYIGAIESIKGKTELTPIAKELEMTLVENLKQAIVKADARLANVLANVTSFDKLVETLQKFIDESQQASDVLKNLTTYLSEISNSQTAETVGTLMRVYSGDARMIADLLFTIGQTAANSRQSLQEASKAFEMLIKGTEVEKYLQGPELTIALRPGTTVKLSTKALQEFPWQEAVQGYMSEIKGMMDVLQQLHRWHIVMRSEKLLSQYLPFTSRWSFLKKPLMDIIKKKGTGVMDYMTGMLLSMALGEEGYSISGNSTIDVLKQLQERAESGDQFAKALFVMQTLGGNMFQAVEEGYSKDEIETIVKANLGVKTSISKLADALKDVSVDKEVDEIASNLSSAFKNVLGKTFDKDFVKEFASKLKSQLGELANQYGEARVTENVIQTVIESLKETSKYKEKVKDLEETLKKSSEALDDLNKAIENTVKYINDLRKEMTMLWEQTPVGETVNKIKAQMQARREQLRVAGVEGLTATTYVYGEMFQSISNVLSSAIGRISHTLVGVLMSTLGFMWSMMSLQQLRNMGARTESQVAKEFDQIFGEVKPNLYAYARAIGSRLAEIPTPYDIYNPTGGVTFTHAITQLNLKQFSELMRAALGAKSPEVALEYIKGQAPEAFNALTAKIEGKIPEEVLGRGLYAMASAYVRKMFDIRWGYESPLMASATDRIIGKLGWIGDILIGIYKVVERLAGIFGVRVNVGPITAMINDYLKSITTGKGLENINLENITVGQALALARNIQREVEEAPLKAEMEIQSLTVQMSETEYEKAAKGLTEFNEQLRQSTEAQNILSGYSKEIEYYTVGAKYGMIFQVIEGMFSTMHLLFGVLPFLLGTFATAVSNAGMAVERLAIAAQNAAVSLAGSPNTGGWIVRNRGVISRLSTGLAITSAVIGILHATGIDSWIQERFTGKPVQDVIITDDGKVFETDVRDWIIATKHPEQVLKVNDVAISPTGSYTENIQFKESATVPYLIEINRNTRTTADTLTKQLPNILGALFNIIMLLYPLQFLMKKEETPKIEYTWRTPKVLLVENGGLPEAKTLTLSEMPARGIETAQTVNEGTTIVPRVTDTIQQIIEKVGTRFERVIPDRTDKTKNDKSDKGDKNEKAIRDHTERVIKTLKDLNDKADEINKELRNENRDESERTNREDMKDYGKLLKDVLDNLHLVEKIAADIRVDVMNGKIGIHDAVILLKELDDTAKTQVELLKQIGDELQKSPKVNEEALKIIEREIEKYEGRTIPLYNDRSDITFRESGLIPFIRDMYNQLKDQALKTPLDTTIFSKYYYLPIEYAKSVILGREAGLFNPMYERATTIDLLEREFGKEFLRENLSVPLWIKPFIYASAIDDIIEERTMEMFGKYGPGIESKAYAINSYAIAGDAFYNYIMRPIASRFGIQLPEIPYGFLGYILPQTPLETGLNITDWIISLPIATQKVLGDIGKWTRWQKLIDIAEHPFFRWFSKYGPGLQTKIDLTRAGYYYGQGEYGHAFEALWGLSQLGTVFQLGNWAIFGDRLQDYVDQLIQNISDQYGSWAGSAVGHALLTGTAALQLVGGNWKQKLAKVGLSILGGALYGTIADYLGISPTPRTKYENIPLSEAGQETSLEEAMSAITRGQVMQNNLGVNAYSIGNYVYYNYGGKWYVMDKDTFERYNEYYKNRAPIAHETDYFKSAVQYASTAIPFVTGGLVGAYELFKKWRSGKISSKWDYISPFSKAFKWQAYGGIAGGIVNAIYDFYKGDYTSALYDLAWPTMDIGILAIDRIGDKIWRKYNIKQLPLTHIPTNPSLWQKVVGFFKPGGKISKTRVGLAISALALLTGAIRSVFAEETPQGQLQYPVYDENGNLIYQPYEQIQQPYETPSSTLAIGDIISMGMTGLLSRKSILKGIGLISKYGLKDALKFGGKTLAKKIPIASLLFSGYFAYQRAKEGDYIGAGLEFASGLAATVPVIGTALSFGIDALTLGYDMFLRDRLTNVNQFIGQYGVGPLGHLLLQGSLNPASMMALPHSLHLDWKTLGGIGLGTTSLLTFITSRERLRSVNTEELVQIVNPLKLITQTFKSLVTPLKSLTNLTRIFEPLKTLTSLLRPLTKLTEVFNVNKLQGIIDQLMNPIKSIEQVIRSLKPPISSIRNLIGSISPSIQTIKNLVSHVSGIWNKISSVATSIAEKLNIDQWVSRLKGIFDVDRIVSAISGLGRYISTIPETLSRAFSSLRSTFTTLFSSLKESFSTMFKAIQSGYQVLANAIGRIASAISEMGSKIASALSGFAQTVGQYVSSAYQQITGEIINHLPIGK